MAILKRRIGEICTPRVMGVPPDATVSDAVLMMQREHISCVLVLDGDMPAGIFTERNVVRYAASRGNGILSLPIREVMSAPVLSAEKDLLIYEAFNLLAHSKIRHLVVVDAAGRAVGMLTQSNIIDHLGQEYALGVQPVGEVMSRIVFSLDPEALVGRAVNEMADKSISCLVVAEEGAPVGLVTERDAARLVLDGDAFGKTLREVMSAPVRTVPQRTTVHEAAAIMNREGVRRLVVVDDAGVLTGLVTQSNIVKVLEGKYVETLREVIQEKDDKLSSIAQELFEKTVYLDTILRQSMDMGVVATDGEGVVTLYSPAAEDMLGYPAHHAVGESIHDIHRRLKVDPQRMGEAMRALLNGGSHTFTILRTQGQRQRYIEASVSRIPGRRDQTLGFVLLVRDETERRVAEQTIRRLAYYDSITGLPNRVLFSERLEMVLALSRRKKSRVGLMLMDLDRFKAVNDNLGHRTGDLLLKALAERLRGLFRESDTFARMCGDEFTVILPDIHDAGDALHLAGRMAQALQSPFSIEGHTLDVGASIGIALFPDHGDSAETLLHMADKAMYRAKERGADADRVSFRVYGRP
jgi:diguanylate cyclase (GGDEF)-like protein/PAS domain S-box-containing protein